MDTTEIQEVDIRALTDGFVDDLLADFHEGTAGHDLTTLTQRCARHLSTDGNSQSSRLKSPSKSGWTYAAGLYIAVQIIYMQKEMLAHVERFELMYLELEIPEERRSLIDELMEARLKTASK